ncbi:unnamed protein product [Symbiodinium sp. CCMP2592]|nr:unnamed protein product [Symbiodinium sp. CCMP2592]
MVMHNFCHPCDCQVMDSLSSRSTVQQLATALQLSIPVSAASLGDSTLLSFGLGTVNLEGLDALLASKGWSPDADELPVLRMLWVQAHKICTLPSVASDTSASTLHSSWAETFPPKLSTETTLQLKRDFEKAYPSEVLDDTNFPSARLLSLAYRLKGTTDWKFISWKHRLSKQQEEDYNSARPRKLARFENFTDVLYDDVPSRNVAENMGLYGISNLLSIHSNALALADIAHLATLRSYERKFLKHVQARTDPTLRPPTHRSAKPRLAPFKGGKKGDGKGGKEPWKGHTPKGGKSTGGKGGTTPGKGKSTFTKGTHAFEWANKAKINGETKVLCMAYSTHKGCTSNNCKFEHLCPVILENGKICLQKHPAFQHAQKAGEEGLVPVALPADATGFFLDINGGPGALFQQHFLELAVILSRSLPKFSLNVALLHILLCASDFSSSLFERMIQIAHACFAEMGADAIFWDPQRHIKERFEPPFANQDGAGIYSDVLCDLRSKLRQWIFDEKIPQRLQAHALLHSSKPLFQEVEIQHLRQLFQSWVSEQGSSHVVDWTIPDHQPYALHALKFFSEFVKDKDDTLCQCLLDGVPTGYDSDIPLSKVFIPHPSAPELDHQLSIAKDNWQSANNDPDTLRELVHAEVQKGWLFEMPSLQAAQERWGERVYKMFEIAFLYAFMQACVKASISTSRRRIKRFVSKRRTRDCLVSLYREKRVKMTNFSFTGANFSALWFQRLAGMLLRLMHLWIFVRHALMGYVDDFLFIQDRECILYSASLLLCFTSIFGVPLSWAKLQLGSCITWIGWTFNFTSGSFHIPQEKVDKLFNLIKEATRSRRVTSALLHKLVGLLQWFCQLYRSCKPWLASLFSDLHRHLASQYSISQGLWPSLANYLDDDLRFTSVPPGTQVPLGGKLLEARHTELKTKQDLCKVRTSNRIWIRVTNPKSDRRSLSPATRTFLSFWREWCQIPQPYTALSVPLRLQVEAFADARADGELIGIGGFIAFPSGAYIWFSQAWQLSDLSVLGLELRRPAHKDIACYETLAQIALVHAYRSVFPSGRVAVRLPSFSDNASTEALGAKLYTAKWPLGAFAQKLSLISAASGIELDISHIAGEKNDDADMLSRWNQTDSLPDKWRKEDRVDCSLKFIWFFRKEVLVWPSHFSLPAVTQERHVSDDDI